MYGNKNDDKELVCNVHLTLREITTRRGGMALQVESWNVGPRRLVLRDVYTAEDGTKKFGKAKGLAMEDLVLIRERFDEITKAMEARS